MASVPAAENLRVLRRAAGLSQEALADRCGISERTIRTLEAGRAQRPHRDTLVALAEALGLPHPAWEGFVGSWRGSSFHLGELMSAPRSHDALIAEYVRQRSLVTELTLNDYVRIDAEGHWIDSTVRRSFEVTGTGLDRFLWLRGYEPRLTDPARLQVFDCRNVEVGTVTDVPEWSARAWSGSLGRELPVGEVYTLQWTYDWAGAAIPRFDGLRDTEAVAALPRSVRSMSIEVAFTPGRLPAGAWYVVQDIVTGPQRKVRPLKISPFGIVQLHLDPAPAGAHGVAWEWDEPTGTTP